MHVKKEDTVIVISGKDKGKKGRVIAAYPRENRVLVEGVNMVKKHRKPNQRTHKAASEREASDSCFERHVRGSKERKSDPYRIQSVG